MYLPDPDTLARWKNYATWTVKGFLIFLPLHITLLLFGDRYGLWYALTT